MSKDNYFHDNSDIVKAMLDNISIATLEEIAGEIVTHAVRNTSIEGWTNSERTALRDGYAYELYEDEGKALIGNRKESAYWEEWGTGEYAAHGDGRKGWWIYIPGQASMGGGRTYATKEEAERMAAYIEKKHGKKAVVTNGRRPNYTLEKAFLSQKELFPEVLAENLQDQFGK